MHKILKYDVFYNSAFSIQLNMHHTLTCKRLKICYFSPIKKTIPGRIIFITYVCICFLGSSSMCSIGGEGKEDNEIGGRTLQSTTSTSGTISANISQQSDTNGPGNYTF